MNDVIQDSEKKITFVPASTGRVEFCGESVCLIPNHDKLLGEVHALDEELQKGVLRPVAHVGSGMRIYLSYKIFDMKDYDRVDVIYHELTHKILNTHDHSYNKDECKRFVREEPRKAIDNAANWGFFIRRIYREWANMFKEEDAQGL